MRFFYHLIVAYFSGPLLCWRRRGRCGVGVYLKYLSGLRNISQRSSMVSPYGAKKPQNRSLSISNTGETHWRAIHVSL